MTHLSIVAGTVEMLVVEVEDQLDEVTSLVGLGATFDVKDKADNYKQTNVVCTIDPAQPMWARCLIDTTLGGTWTAGKYRLYIKFPNAPESPILGPMEFSVNP